MYYYLCQISKLRVEIDWLEEKKKSDITILKKNVHYSLSEKVKPLKRKLSSDDLS